MPIDLEDVRHLALDLDGTVYRGGSVLPHTAGFLETLRELGIGRSFLTNNSSRSREGYVEHLRSLGIEAGIEDVFSSTMAAAELLRREHPRARRLWVLGAPGLQSELEREGWALCADDPGDEPDAVVVGYDTTLSFERLCRTAWWIGRGIPFIATHLDRVCPTDEPTLRVDCGALCACLESATGRGPDAAPGKPDLGMLRGIQERLGLGAGELAMVGDRLYTDIRMANAAGIPGVLVLTGETRAEDLPGSPDRPDLVVEHLGELGDRLREARA